MGIYPEILVSGTHMMDFWYRIEYDEELALAGLPPYYVHRSRYQRDGLRNPRQVSQLPLPEPNVLLGGTRNNFGDYFADVVIAKTFEEAIGFLGVPYRGNTAKGYIDDWTRFKAERAKIDRDAEIAHEDEKLQAMSDETGHPQLRLF